MAAKIVHVGKITREVKEWQYPQGIPMCVRKSQVNRVHQPDFDWQNEDDLVLQNVRNGIRAIKRKPATSSLHTKKAREESLLELQQQEKDLVARRSPLTKWEEEEIRRCIKGHGTLTGFHYFLFNYAWYQEVNEQSGTIVNIRPSYRTCDDWIGRGLLEAQKTKSGVCMIKRRRLGWSWILCTFILWNMLFNDSSIFFVTKDEDDRKKLFQRLNFQYDQLPQFLRKEWGNNATEWKTMLPSKRFARIRKIPFEEIPEAVIRCASPKNVTTVEGGTCSIFIVDEGGKIPNLESVLDLGEPMLAGSNGLTRAGCLIVGGTVGDMDESGHAIQTLYKNPKLYNTMPMFASGWMGFDPDRYGNDNKEEAKKIITDRRDTYKAAGKLTKLATFTQQYPLTEEEAFSIDASKKLMPVEFLNKAEAMYEAVYRRKFKFGRFAWGENGTVVFNREEPNVEETPEGGGKVKRFDTTGRGQIIMLEPPLDSLAGYKNPYVMGVDPVDLDLDEYKESGNKSRFMHSDIAFEIYKRHAEVGGDADYPVCVYFGRPTYLDEAYEQCMLASIYYFEALMNIERQKGARMHNYIVGRGYEHLIAYGVGIAQETESNEGRWGFHANQRWKSDGVRNAKEHIKKHAAKPMPKRLIDELLYLGEANTDLAVAHQACLQMSNEYDIREQYYNPLRPESLVVDHRSFTRRNGILTPINSGQGSKSQELRNQIMQARYGKRGA